MKDILLPREHSINALLISLIAISLLVACDTEASTNPTKQQSPIVTVTTETLQNNEERLVVNLIIDEERGPSLQFPPEASMKDIFLFESGEQILTIRYKGLDWLVYMAKTPGEFTVSNQGVDRVNNEEGYAISKTVPNKVLFLTVDGQSYLFDYTTGDISPILLKTPETEAKI